MRSEKAILNVTRGTVVCERGVLADRSLQRMRGLLGTRDLSPDKGLLLTPAPSVHTAFMRYPIDVVFLDRDSVVVKVVEGVRPWRAVSARRARAALELAEGESRRRGVQVGDWLIRVSDELIWDAQADGRRPHELLGAGAAALRRDGPGDVPEQAAGEPGRLRQLLLVSRDRRFRAVMAVLLNARGFAITLATHLPDGPLAEDAGVEVVVIDAGDALQAVMGQAADAGLLSSDRPAFFVTDTGDAALSAPRVAPKWESLERLCDEIAASGAPPLSDVRAERAPSIPVDGEKV